MALGPNHTQLVRWTSSEISFATGPETDAVKRQGCSRTEPLSLLKTIKVLSVQYLQFISNTTAAGPSLSMRAELLLRPQVYLEAAVNPRPSPNHGVLIDIGPAAFQA
jgi:hypothetical protein